MSMRLYNAFEVCLAAIATGVDLEICLSLYPDLSNELRPALETAQYARLAARQEDPKAAMMRSRTRFMSRAAELRARQRPFFLSLAFPRLAIVALACLLVIIGSMNGLVVASAKALPGDTLYPVKRAAENVSLSLARDIEVRQQMEESYLHRRAEEIHGLLAQKRVRNISMEGIVSEASAEHLLVNGIPVRLKDGAIVNGEIQPGRVIEVEGQTQPGGWIEADELHLRFFEQAGELMAIDPGFWTVGETRFKISPTTRIDPALKTGDQVLVLVYSSDDGLNYAQAILRFPDTLPGKTGFQPFEIEFSGTITAVSGDVLTIDGKTVRLTDKADIKGAITSGALVKIHAEVAADGSLTAVEIENIAQLDQMDGHQLGDDPDDPTGTDTMDESESSGSGSAGFSDDHPGGEDQSNSDDGKSGSDVKSQDKDDDNSGSGSSEDDTAGDDDHSDNSGEGNGEKDSSNNSGESGKDD